MPERLVCEVLQKERYINTLTVVRLSLSLIWLKLELGYKVLQSGRADFAY